MAESGNSRADTNRKIRQEGMREMLISQGHILHVVEITEKLRDLSQELDANEVTRLRAAAELKMKIVNKYLPDVKMTEITGEGGGPVQLQEVRRVIVDPKHTDG